MLKREKQLANNVIIQWLSVFNGVWYALFLLQQLGNFRYHKILFNFWCAVSSTDSIVALKMFVSHACVATVVKILFKILAS